jgi:hypothetical protein
MPLDKPIVRIFAWNELANSIAATWGTTGLECDDYSAVGVFRLAGSGWYCVMAEGVKKWLPCFVQCKVVD